VDKKRRSRKKQFWQQIFQFFVLGRNWDKYTGTPNLVIRLYPLQALRISRSLYKKFELKLGGHCQGRLEGITSEENYSVKSNL